MPLFLRVPWQVLLGLLMMARGRGLTRSVEAESPGMIGRFMPRAAKPRVITITKDKTNDFVRKLLYKKTPVLFIPAG